MTISPTTTLFKPIPGEQVPRGTLAYFSARAKRHAYDLVIRELKASGITRSELALRLDMDMGQLSRTLGGPGNWTIDTASRLLFAICGKTLAYRADNPLDKQARNLLQAQVSAALDVAKEFERTLPRPSSSAVSNDNIGWGMASSVPAATAYGC